MFVREQPPASLVVECVKIPQFEGRTSGDLYDWAMNYILPLYAECAERQRELRDWATR